MVSLFSKDFFFLKFEWPIVTVNKQCGINWLNEIYETMLQRNSYQKYANRFCEVNLKFFLLNLSCERISIISLFDFCGNCQVLCELNLAKLQSELTRTMVSSIYLRSIAYILPNQYKHNAMAKSFRKARSKYNYAYLK